MWVGVGRRRLEAGLGGPHVPGEPLARPCRALARVNHPGLRSVRGGARRVELSRDGPWPRGERSGLGGRACVRRVSGRPWLLTFEWARCTSCALRHHLPLIVWKVYTCRGGRPGETGYEKAFIALNVQFWGYGEGSSLTAVFLSAENMAAQREWTPMVSSR